MMKKVRIDEAGDTSLLPSSLVDKSEMEAENRAIRERIEAGETELREATYTPCIVGYYKSFFGNRFLLVSGIFPRDNSCIDRCGNQRKSGSSIGSERERYYR